MTVLSPYSLTSCPLVFVFGGSQRHEGVPLVIPAKACKSTRLGELRETLVTNGRDQSNAFCFIAGRMLVRTTCLLPGACPQVVAAWRLSPGSSGNARPRAANLSVFKVATRQSNSLIPGSLSLRHAVEPWVQLSRPVTRQQCAVASFGERLNEVNNDNIRTNDLPRDSTARLVVSFHIPCLCGDQPECGSGAIASDPVSPHQQPRAFALQHDLTGTFAVCRARFFKSAL